MCKQVLGPVYCLPCMKESVCYRLIQPKIFRSSHLSWLEIKLTNSISQFLIVVKISKYAARILKRNFNSACAFVSFTGSIWRHACRTKTVFHGSLRRQPGWENRYQRGEYSGIINRVFDSYDFICVCNLPRKIWSM